jgi:hypothetical protein
MGPQLGVATVLMLVVGIGLWYLPQLSGAGGHSTAPLLEPEPMQTSEASALEPAEPLQLTHDPRTGRVTVETAGSSAQLPGTSTETPGEVAHAESVRPSTEPRDVRTEATRDELAAPPPVPDDSAETELALAVEQQVPAEGPVAGRVQTDSLPELSSAAGSLETGPLPTAGMGVAAPSTQPSAQLRPSTPSFDLDVPSGPAADDLGAAALHGQARQLAAAGRCQDSVARYQQLQSRYPSYPEGGRASMEMADCLRRLGRTREARSSLERATHSPVGTVAAAARRELLEMDTAERAAEAATPTAEAATQ